MSLKSPMPKAPSITQRRFWSLRAGVAVGIRNEKQFWERTFVLSPAMVVFQKQNVIVIGDGNHAAIEAMHLTSYQQNCDCKPQQDFLFGKDHGGSSGKRNRV